MLLLNSFSLNMIKELPVKVDVKELSANEAMAILAKGFESAVGHADTAKVLEGILKMPVAFNRATVVLEKFSHHIVAQLSGTRLPEGTTTLPPGAVIKFLLVTVS